MVVLPNLTGVDLDWGWGLAGNGAVDYDMCVHTIGKSFNPDLWVLLPRRFRSRELDVNSLAQAVRALFEFEELNGNF